MAPGTHLGTHGLYVALVEVVVASQHGKGAVGAVLRAERDMHVESELAHSVSPLDLQGGEEGFLRNLDPAELLHAFFTFLLSLQ